MNNPNSQQGFYSPSQQQYNTQYSSSNIWNQQPSSYSFPTYTPAPADSTNTSKNVAKVILFVSVFAVSGYIAYVLNSSSNKGLQKPINNEPSSVEVPQIIATTPKPQKPIPAKSNSPQSPRSSKYSPAN
jgi:hypothetical protein